MVQNTHDLDDVYTKLIVIPRHLSHLARVLVHEMEDSVQLGIPVDALAQSPPPQLACDYLQQVHLNRLLNEHHVVL